MVKKQNKWQQYVAILIAVIAVIAFGWWYWFTISFSNPETTFWDTIDQNLQAGYVSKTTQQKDGNQSLVQVNNLQFKGQLVAQNLVTIKDTTPSKSSLVITETIGTIKADYLRYTKIESSSIKVNPAVINVWAITNDKQGQQPQILAESLLTSPIMFGYLNSQKRAAIVNELKAQKVFGVDFKSANLNENVNGKKAYSYQLNIQLSKYMQIYKKYLISIGEESLAKQFGQASSGTTYKATLYVDYLSRQPLKLLPQGATTPEEFSNFGLNANLTAPKNVKLTVEELRLKFNQ